MPHDQAYLQAEKKIEQARIRIYRLSFLKPTILI